MATVLDKTWTLNDSAAITATNVSTVIDGIADYVTASVTGWSVVDNDVVSTNGRQILLKPDAADLAGLKVAIYGGVVPNAANVDSLANAGYLYIAAHENHPGDTFDANFDTSQMLTGTGFVPGRVFGAGLTGLDRVRIVSNANELVLCLYDQSDSNPMYQALAGIVGRTPAGEHIVGVFGGGNSTVVSSGALESPTSIGLIQGDETPSTTASGGNAVFSGTNRNIARAFAAFNTTVLETFTTRDGHYFTTDLPLCDEDGYIIGYANQIGVGRDSTCFQEYTDTLGNIYTTISHSLTTAGNAFWLKTPA